MRSARVSEVNVFEFEVARFESFDAFSFGAPGIDEGYAFHESVDIDR